jgi:hypothetical protein
MTPETGGNSALRDSIARRHFKKERYFSIRRERMNWKVIVVSKDFRFN